MPRIPPDFSTSDKALATIAEDKLQSVLTNAMRRNIAKRLGAKLIRLLGGPMEGARPPWVIPNNTYMRPVHADDKDDYSSTGDQQRSPICGVFVDITLYVPGDEISVKHLLEMNERDIERKTKVTKSRSSKGVVPNAKRSMTKIDKVRAKQAKIARLLKDLEGA